MDSRILVWHPAFDASAGRAKEMAEQLGVAGNTAEVVYTADADFKRHCGVFCEHIARKTKLPHTVRVVAVENPAWGSRDRLLGDAIDLDCGFRAGGAEMLIYCLTAKTVKTVDGWPEGSQYRNN